VENELGGPRRNLPSESRSYQSGTSSGSKRHPGLQACGSLWTQRLTFDEMCSRTFLHRNYGPMLDLRILLRACKGIVWRWSLLIADANPKEATMFKNILVPVDGSSMRCVRWTWVRSGAKIRRNAAPGSRYPPSLPIRWRATDIEPIIAR